MLAGIVRRSSNHQVNNVYISSDHIQDICLKNLFQILQPFHVVEVKPQNARASFKSEIYNIRQKGKHVFVFW